MTTKPTVAIAGATGLLGQHITTALLSPTFNTSFTRIILLTRDSTSPLLQKWKSTSNVEIRTYNPASIGPSIADADVLINAIGSSGHEFKDALVQALPGSKVKLYFPSEFGVDHYIHDFPHKEWDAKKRHFELVEQVAPRVRVCRVFCGLFLEDSIGPWFGFDTKNGRYECVGSAKIGVSFTAKEDVGRTVAELAGRELETVPEVVHVAGDTVSVSKIAELMTGAGAGETQITEIELEKYKRETLKEITAEPSKYLRFLMGEGKINHGEGGIAARQVDDDDEDDIEEIPRPELSQQDISKEVSDAIGASNFLPTDQDSLDKTEKEIAEQSLEELLAAAGYSIGGDESSEVDEPESVVESPKQEKKHAGKAFTNSNEVVNPGQKKWRWKTMEDLATETKGKPWADAAWPPA